MFHLDDLEAVTSKSDTYLRDPSALHHIFMYQS